MLQIQTNVFGCVQHGITMMKWDQSGHLLATCANEPHLKLWSLGDEGLVCQHDIVHTLGLVNVMEWCALIGTDKNPRILFARYVESLNLSQYHTSDECSVRNIYAVHCVWYLQFKCSRFNLLQWNVRRRSLCVVDPTAAV